MPWEVFKRRAALDEGEGGTDTWHFSTYGLGGCGSMQNGLERTSQQDKSPTTIMIQLERVKLA